MLDFVLKTRYINSIVNKKKENQMSNMDFNTSILYVKTFNDGTKFLVDSCGKNSWGSTAKESCDGAIADFVAEGGNAQDIISIETVDMREVA